jgi:hypothetical protein
MLYRSSTCAFALAAALMATMGCARAADVRFKHKLRRRKGGA